MLIIKGREWCHLLINSTDQKLKINVIVEIIENMCNSPKNRAKRAFWLIINIKYESRPRGGERSEADDLGFWGFGDSDLVETYNFL